MVKFSKDLKWLQDYVSLAKRKLPQVDKIKRVQIITPQSGQLCRRHGSISVNSDHTYTIRLYVNYNGLITLNPAPLLKEKTFSKIDILSTLAHEIAHIKHWAHSPQHKVLESEILILFMGRLKDTYVSEEDEFTHRK